MKKFLLVICGVWIVTNSFSQKNIANNNGFVITADIAGLPDNTPVYLAGNGETDTIASASAHNHSFTLKGILPGYEGAMLIFPTLNKRQYLFIGNENVHITATNASLEDLYISGSKTQQDYESFMNEIVPLNEFVKYYREQLTYAATESQRDSVMIMLNTAYNIYQTSIDRFIGRRKSSPVSSLVLAYSYDMDPNKNVELLEKRLATLDSNALTTKYGQGIKQVIADAKVGAIGTIAENFSQKDTAGKTVSLTQFRGKYVLIDFWASWCRPCRMENPNVVAAYNAFKNKNFTILSVSLDQDKDSWLNAIKTDQLAWTHVSDLQYWNNAAARLYHVQSIPQNFLIDPNGVIIARNLRGEELMEKLQQLIH